jgi:hypothetical protein
MNINRNREKRFAMRALAFILPAAMAAAGWSVPAAAQQAYPAKPVRMISPFPPGGGNDTLCRIVAQKLAEEFRQQVIVENRAGANGIIGTEIYGPAPLGKSVFDVEAINETFDMRLAGNPAFVTSSLRHWG